MNKKLIFVLLLIATLLLSVKAKAQDFEKKYYEVIKSIIWAADKVEVPRELLLALCWNESSFRLKSVTHIDSDGSMVYSICQVKLATAKWMDELYNNKTKATPARLEQPKINAFYAAQYLKYQLENYNQDWKLAVDGYNKGSAVGKKTKYVKRFEESLGIIHNKLPSKGLQYARY